MRWPFTVGLWVAVLFIGAGAHAQDAQQAPSQAQTEAEAFPDVDTLLGGVDANLTFTSRAATMRMTVEGKRRTRVFEMQSFGRGEDQAAIEYLAPARDKGTKMLRRGDELWMFMPAVDRVQKISGHMLRQGMMGSDVSYEDMMGAAALRDAYTAEVVGSETVGGEAVWKVEMKAKDDSVAYPRRVAWITKDSRVPVRQELYALSGMKLKTWEMSEVKTFDGDRRFPTRMEIIDHVSEGGRTIIELTEMSFGVELDNEVFSQRWLERR